MSLNCSVFLFTLFCYSSSGATNLWYQGSSHRIFFCSPGILFTIPRHPLLPPVPPGDGAHCDWTMSVTGTASLSQYGGCRTGGGGGGTKSPKERLPSSPMDMTSQKASKENLNWRLLFGTDLFLWTNNQCRFIRNDLWVPDGWTIVALFLMVYDSMQIYCIYDIPIEINISRSQVPKDLCSPSRYDGIIE